VINIKQMVLQTMLMGQDYLDCSKALIRSGLRDSTIQLPSGAAGAMVTASGSSAVTLLTACLRPATRLEALLAPGTAQTGTVTGHLFTFQGDVDGYQIDEVRKAP
jgi:hypothetical protein